MRVGKSDNAPTDTTPVQCAAIQHLDIETCAELNPKFVEHLKKVVPCLVWNEQSAKRASFQGRFY